MTFVDTLSYRFLLVYSFSVFGVAFALGHATITDGVRSALWEARRGRIGIRFFVALLECPGCLGFHVGWLYAWLVFHTGLVATIAWGAFTMGIVMFLALLCGLVSRRPAANDNGAEA